MIQNIFYSLFFFVFFYFIWDIQILNQKSVRETWIWNKEGKFGTNIPKSGENPQTSLNGYKTNLGYYSFSSRKETPSSPNQFFEYALLGKGYLEYEKIGDSVHFYSEKGELFWTKPINSYPRSGYFSAPVLYLSGDNNTVFLLDTSGNFVGKSELNGRFLTDYVFLSKVGGALVLFSGGEFYRVDEKGNTLLELSFSNEREYDRIFYKSVSVSPDGKYFAVHHSIEEKDYIRIYNETGRELEEILLDKLYPHKIYFLVTNEGNLLLNLPEKIQYYKADKLVWEKEKSKSSGIYQVLLALDDYLVYLEESNLIFLNTEGGVIRTKRIPQSEMPLRLFPGKESGNFYLETKSDIYQFRLL